MAWLRKEFKQLQRDYPQLNPLKFDISKEPDRGPLSKDDLRALLGGPPSAALHRQTRPETSVVCPAS